MLIILLTQPLSNPISSIIISAHSLSLLAALFFKGRQGLRPWWHSSQILKEFADEVAPVLCHLIPLILILCTSPSSWKPCTHLFTLFLRKVTAPTPPTIALLLSLRLLLRYSKLCLTPTSSDISNLTVSFRSPVGFRKARSTGDLLSYLTHTWSSSLRNFG